MRAIRNAQKNSPHLIDLLVRIATNSKNEIKDRIRAAEIVLNKAIPSVHGQNTLISAQGASCLRIEIIDPHTDQMIDVTPDPQYTDDEPARAGPLVLTLAPHTED